MEKEKSSVPATQRKEERLVMMVVVVGRSPLPPGSALGQNWGMESRRKKLDSSKETLARTNFCVVFSEANTNSNMYRTQHRRWDPGSRAAPEADSCDFVGFQGLHGTRKELAAQGLDSCQIVKLTWRSQIDCETFLVFQNSRGVGCSEPRDFLPTNRHAQTR